MEEEVCNSGDETDTGPLATDDMECEMTKLVGQPLIEHILDTGQSMDTVITLADGKLGAHRMVLAAASSFLGELLIEQGAKASATLILPDISKHTMELMLTLAYTGSVNFSVEDEDDLFGAMSALYFGSTFDVSIHRLPPRLKPVLPSTSGSSSSRPKIVQMQESYSDNESDADDEDEDDETPPLYQPEEKKTPARKKSSSSATCPSKSGCCSDSSTRPTAVAVSFQCSSCPRTFRRESQLQLHVEKEHTSKILAAFGEVRIVTYCPECDTQWKTLDRAQKCLNSHGLARCWICFDVFDRVGIKSHYLLHHCDESSILDSHNTFIRCRWCEKRVNIKMGVASIATHSFTHIPTQQEAKGSKGGSGHNSTLEDELTGNENADDDNDDLFETTAVDGSTLLLKYKTLKGEETLEVEKISAESRPASNSFPSPAKYIPRPKSVMKLCEIQEVLIIPPKILLSRLPKPVEDIIFRRVCVPPTPATKEEEPKLAAKESDQSAITTQEMDQPGTNVTGNDELPETSFNFITPPPSGDCDEGGTSDCLPEISIVTKEKETEKGNSAGKSNEDGKLKEKRKRRRSSTAPTPARASPKAVTMAMELHTEKWGNFSVVMENLSKANNNESSVAQSHCPKNATLVVRKSAMEAVWKEVDKKMEGAEVDTWRIRCSGTADPFEEIFKYLKAKKRTGSITSDEFTQPIEIMLFPLTKSNYAQLVKRLPSLPKPDDEENQLLALLFLPEAPPPAASIDTTPSQAKKKRGRKRRMSRRGDTPTTSDRQTRRSYRKRPRVLPLLKLDHDLDLNSSEAGGTGSNRQRSTASDGSFLKVPRLSSTVASRTSSAKVKKLVRSR